LKGWLRAIREALGMPAAQLARRMEISQSVVLGYELREARGTITLESLDRAAQAMGCRLVYALVPKGTLESLVDEQSLRSAEKLLAPVLHSMALEAQEPSVAERKAQLERMAKELKEKARPELWGTR
jgi:predicted DNA-binding mobile mystery protein A